MTRVDLLWANFFLCGIFTSDLMGRYASMSFLPFDDKISNTAKLD